MDPDKIKELIELISKSNFEKFELEEGDFKLRLVKQRAGKPEASEQVVTVAGAPPQSVLAGAETVGGTASATATGGGAGADPSLIDIPSPIVGTFYSSPNPEASSFVKPGAHVSKGQVICIIEAMKVMNEIESEYDGEIVEVLVSNGQPVEFGEPIFRFRPA